MLISPLISSSSVVHYLHVVTSQYNHYQTYAHIYRITHCNCTMYTCTFGHHMAGTFISPPFPLFLLKLILAFINNIYFFLLDLFSFSLIFIYLNIVHITVLTVACIQLSCLFVIVFWLPLSLPHVSSISCSPLSVLGSNLESFENKFNENSSDFTSEGWIQVVHFCPALFNLFITN